MATSPPLNRLAVAVLCGWWWVGLWQFRVRDLPRIVLDTVETTGVMMALVMRRGVAGLRALLSRLPQNFGGWLTQTVTSPIVRYLILVNLMSWSVGCFMEAIAAMLILIPILVPPALALRIDPIQFGVVVSSI